ncbi:hypothetical protein ABN584_20730 [Gloeocapsa sp. BRSZ]
MYNAVEMYIKQFAQLPTAQLQAFITKGRLLKIPRKASFLEAGVKCEQVAFIHSGILRYHVIDPVRLLFGAGLHCQEQASLSLYLNASLPLS